VLLGVTLDGQASHHSEAERVVVKAMTLIPRRAAARAISSIDSFPSDHVECVCRSP